MQLQLCMSIYSLSLHSFQIYEHELLCDYDNLFVTAFFEIARSAWISGEIHGFGLDRENQDPVRSHNY